MKKVYYTAFATVTQTKRKAEMQNPILRKLAYRLAILAAIVGAFGLGVQHATPPKYAVDDLNKDGKVNVQDLSIFLSNYPKAKGEKLEINLE